MRKKNNVTKKKYNKKVGYVVWADIWYKITP